MAWAGGAGFEPGQPGASEGAAGRRGRTVLLEGTPLPGAGEAAVTGQQGPREVKPSL